MTHIETTLSIELESGEEVQVTAVGDYYKGTRQPDDPREMDLLHTRINGRDFVLTDAQNARCIDALWRQLEDGL